MKYFSRAHRHSLKKISKTKKLLKLKRSEVSLSRPNTIDYPSFNYSFCFWDMLELTRRVSRVLTREPITADFQASSAPGVLRASTTAVHWGLHLSKYGPGSPCNEDSMGSSLH